MLALMATTRTSAVVSQKNPRIHSSMNKLLIALCAVAFSATALAQGTTPAAPMKTEPPKAEAPMKAAEPAKAAPMKAEAAKPATADAAKPTTVKKKTKKKAKSAAPKTSAGTAEKPAK